MPYATVNTFDSSGPDSGERCETTEIRLYYETHGDPADPALLLVNGYSSQILGWRAGFREQLAERGRFVISFDNRDVGLSTHLDGVEVDVVAVTKAALAGEPVPGAHLLLLGDMGHDLPEPLWPVIIDAIISHTAHAAARGVGGT